MFLIVIFFLAGFLLGVIKFAMMYRKQHSFNKKLLEQTIPIAFCKLEFLNWKTDLNHFALKYKLIISANRRAFQELQKIKNQILLA